LRDAAAKEKSGVSVCEKKRKADGKTIYYRTKDQREKDTSTTQERSEARKNLGFAKKGRLSKINKAAMDEYLSEIKSIREELQKIKPSAKPEAEPKPEAKPEALAEEKQAPTVL